METRNCLTCHDPLKGRSDKRFCSDQCRANFNNQNRSESEKVIQQVNQVLRKNRTILKTLNPVGMSVIRKKFLEDRKFNFKYFTSLFKTNEGNEYWFCYDMGYMFLEDNKIRIVEHQKYMKG
jgi:predicted nucleic acid-binding Zn ribbon protein